MSITCMNLNSSEKVALSAIEITEIPHVSIINSGQFSEQEVNIKYKNDILRLLNEVFQQYKSKNKDGNWLNDISIELLWITEKIDNQPYKASIKLFIIVRAIDNDESNAASTVNVICRICESTLNLQRYAYKKITFDELSESIIKIDDSNIKAIVKNENLENLQNTYMQYCYSFDRFPVNNSNLSRIVNSLVDYPNSAVSIQLFPIKYISEEVDTIDYTSQTLSTLANGIASQGVGNVSFGLANKHAETYEYYSSNKNNSLYSYNILIYGNKTAVSNLSSAVFGQLSSGESYSADLKLVTLQNDEVNKNLNFYPLPWAVNEVLINKDRNSSIWTSGQFPREYYRLPYIITAEEASELFRLPIGSDSVSVGLSVDEYSKGGKTYSDSIINDGDITIGKIKSNGDNTIGIRLNDLAKHMLVVGTPGSGKTTFSISLLDRLWKEHNIPFLVIEPAKNEYRALIKSIPDIQVFTPGKNFISPFVFNPFVPPKNVVLETYKSTLKTAFAAGVSMSTPLDKIFEESVNNCYSDFKWLDTYTIDSGAELFNISDFIKCFQETFDEIGYTGDAKNIGRAGLVRLKGLVNLFDNYFSIPIEDILSKPTVIELAAVENSDEKALIIAILLLSILSYVNANYVGNGGLKNVILLEEAHVLLDSSSNSSQGDANPSAIAQGLIKRMLAEIRSYGVGLVIADQSPRKVGTDVVALTDMKMIFRLVENDDKTIISNSTGMDDSQVQHLARLRPGEAFLFFNRLDEPEEVITPDYRLENNIDISLSDESIKQLSTYWNDKRINLRPYPQCRYVKYCEFDCDYDRRILAKEVARRIFRKQIANAENKKDAFIKTIKNLAVLIRNELNFEEYSDELNRCVQVHLLRNIKYSTNLTISNELVEKLLSK